MKKVTILTFILMPTKNKLFYVTLIKVRSCALHETFLVVFLCPVQNSVFFCNQCINVLENTVSFRAK